ncbi:MAG TPA: Rho-binding antiterminator [Thermoanaerobaculia bacterium]|nr:Rho-binding antiterminator [Thermoanaerobaculia bacterium]
MADKDYSPVSCDYHDQLEAAAMHGKEVRLEFEQQGARQDQRGKIGDVFTEDGAEYVRFEGGKGALKIRLDEIVSFTEL